MPWLVGLRGSATDAPFVPAPYNSYDRQMGMRSNGGETVPKIGGHKDPRCLLTHGGGCGDVAPATTQCQTSAGGNCV